MSKPRIVVGTYGNIMDARYLPEPKVQEVSHVESLKALGYVVE